ncbi:predicted protein, partial [Naegleria gruberi]
ESVHYSSLAHPIDLCTKISKSLIALYAVGEGQVELASHYLKYIKEFQNDPLLDNVKKMKFEMLASKIESHISAGDDDVESLKIVWKLFTKFYDVYVNDNKYDLQSINNGVSLENAPITISLICSVRELLYNMISNKSLTNNQKHIKHASIELMHLYGIYSTFKYLNLQVHAMKEIVEKVELLLTDLPLLLPLYSFHNLAVFVYYRINQFDSVRKNVIEKLVHGRNIRDVFEDEEERIYFEKVLLHINLVNSFSSRYRMIPKLFPRLVRELNSIVKWKFDLQMTCLKPCITDEMPTNIMPKETTTDDQRYQSCFERYRASIRENIGSYGF